MKTTMMIKLMGKALGGMIKEGVPEKSTRKQIEKTYLEIFSRAADIGSGNNLVGAYALAAYFMAMVRTTGHSPDQDIVTLESGMRKSKLLKAFMGGADGYFSEKKMEFRRQWSKKTYERQYANDWVVDVLEKTPDYDFGFNYRECGVCKLCRDEGCPELAKYLCKLDFMLVDIMGIHLERTQTLAEGADYCDFRFSRKN